MNNEPVAWMHTTICSWVSTFIHPETQPEEWTPLYTHPVKTLTDEEITEEWAKFYPDVFHTHLINFVRAILKKASDK